VAEVPSFKRSMIHGVSNLNGFSDGVRVLRTILYERFIGPRREQNFPAFCRLRPDLSMSLLRAYRGPFPQLACPIRNEYHRRRRATASPHHLRRQRSMLPGCAHHARNRISR
jgi:hypothetical protein